MYDNKTSSDDWSHPTWVRGLKLRVMGIIISVIVVAPYVGAWIETSILNGMKPQQAVAPYVGAWIETLIWPNIEGLI